MNVLIPTLITQAMLGGTTTIAQPAPAVVELGLLAEIEWVAGTPIAITMTIAAPAVVSWADHELAVGDVVCFATTSALPTGVTAGEIYYVISAGLTTGSFQFSATKGGAAIITITVSATVTMTSANPGVATWLTHGLMANDVVTFTNSGGALPGGVSAATDYFVLSSGLTTNDFKMSLQKNGAAIITTSTGTGVHTGHKGQHGSHTGGRAYVVGDLRIRSTATINKEYGCILNHLGRTTFPENDTEAAGAVSPGWLEKGATRRHAPFDIYSNTAARALGNITYVINAEYFNAIAMYGLFGSTVQVVIRETPAGLIIYDSGLLDLSEPPLGWYEYLFSPLIAINKIVLTNLSPRPDAELTVTVLAAVDAEVAIGMINVGDFTPLFGVSGGTNYGASAEPVSYSFIKTHEDGTMTIKRRTAATGMRATITLATDDADTALLLIQSVLDIPVSWVATTAAGYDGLNVFGLGSASVSYDGPNHATINLNVKGFI